MLGSARESRIGRSLWVSVNVSGCVCVCMEKGKHVKLFDVGIHITS